MEKGAILSFVDKEKNSVVKNIDELNNLIKDCKKHHRVLQDIDISNIELRNIDFSGLVITNVIFNYFIANSVSKKELFNINFKGCKISDCSFPNCSFIRCTFDTEKVTLRELEKETQTPKTKDNKENKKAPTTEDITTDVKNCDFFFSEFNFCRFRNTIMNIIDFRYCQFYNCSLGGIDVTLGDFYMSSFLGSTSFQDSKFSKCSLTFTTFEHEVIRIASIDKLVQECYKEYNEIIIGCKKWRKQNPCGYFSHWNEGEDENNALKSKLSCSQEASKVYAQLSAYYAQNGLNHDSNAAYVRSKTNIAWASLYNILLCKNIFSSIWSLIAFFIYYIFGFGYRMTFVIFDFLILITAGGFMWLHKNIGQIDAVQNTQANWWDAFTYSLINSFGPYEQYYSVVGAFVAGLHTAIGILLVGFLGFILANRIRNN